MNLLLVDDETYTREGLLAEIPWGKLGITQVKQANNGIAALDITKEFIPHILLTDVKMPKMNGIDLAYKIQESNPECSIIFISGYSDKEYLKSAIDLKAVSYIEKPLDLEELQEAIKKSILMYKDTIKNKRYLSKSIPLIKNKLAVNITKTPTEHKSILDNLNNFYPHIVPDTMFQTIVFKLIHNDPFSEIKINIKDKIDYTILEQQLLNHNIQSILGFKDNQYLILHISLNKDWQEKLPVDTIYNIVCKFFDSSVSLYMGVGLAVKGVFNVYLSYNDAVIALQKLFFNSTKKIILYNSNNTAPGFSIDNKHIVNFSKSISDGNKDNAIFIIKKMSANIRNHDNTVENYIREIYFKFLLELIKISDLTNQNLQINSGTIDYSWYYISRFNFLDEIETFIIEKIKKYFEQFTNTTSTTTLCIDILKYIHSNYSNPGLSLKTISQAVSLSPSYICVIFKKEMYTTVMQYVIEYRIEKSIELLKDKSLRLIDISERVGFNDGNYYSKTFKKLKHINPSEYRAKYFNI